MSLTRKTFDRATPASAILSFKRSDGLRHYSLFAYPIRNSDGEVNGILTVGFDVPDRQPSPGEQNAIQ